MRQSKFLIILCLVLALIGVLIAVNFYIGKPQPQQSGTKPIPETFADINPGPKTTSILAPNGRMTLFVTEGKASSGVTDTFSVSVDSGPQTQIYSETLAEGVTISVPYNTFSPDNKYIFLKKSGPAGITYFALRTDGKPIVKDSQTVDFLSLFNSKYPGEFKVTDVTGWGGMTLIVLNTDKPNGSIGPSFWYDAASDSFISLSTRFN